MSTLSMKTRKNWKEWYQCIAGKKCGVVVALFSKELYQVFSPVLGNCQMHSYHRMMMT